MQGKVSRVHPHTWEEESDKQMKCLVKYLNSGLGCSRSLASFVSGRFALN